MNASPAPVVSTSSPGGITSAVPRSNLPLIEPTPSAIILKFGWKQTEAQTNGLGKYYSKLQV
jgi:hypothetical protein